MNDTIKKRALDLFEELKYDFCVEEIHHWPDIPHLASRAKAAMESAERRFLEGIDELKTCTHTQLNKYDRLTTCGHTYDSAEMRQDAYCTFCGGRIT